MRRRRSLIAFVALAAAGLAAGLFESGGRASPQATIRVTVSATDSKFTLSTTSVPTGTVLFTVTNRGKRAHNFKIAGKTTRLIAPGHSATLQVTFSKSGRYAYLSTVSGQAATGLKGTFTVQAATVARTTTTPPSTTVGTATTTVTVDMFDNGGPPHFVLSSFSIPSGMVTFVIKNKCQGQCSFHLVGVRVGAILDPGGEETWTVALAPGTYLYHCDVMDAMKGSFTVTP
jgi:plastocyanin